ncbi:MAG: putative histidine kinase, partial [Myxococcaceae bacterium]|nr:putative histidine kinase [Myxococcaceae bacterium]
TLRRLVGAFSEFARLPDVKPAPADLAEFVRDMAGSRALLDELDPGVTVRFDAGDAPVPVRLDRIMFRRAVENLLRNAVEALAAAGGSVWVRVESREVREPEAAEPTAQAWLVVEDDGPGVPAGQRERVFDPYFTTKATGTGLGLAIVRKIALDHDGDVGLEERPGGGARFVLTLPREGGGRRPRRSFVTFSKAGADAPRAVTSSGG